MIWARNGICYRCRVTGLALGEAIGPFPPERRTAMNEWFDAEDHVERAHELFEAGRWGEADGILPHLPPAAHVARALRSGQGWGGIRRYLHPTPWVEAHWRP